MIPFSAEQLLAHVASTQRAFFQKHVDCKGVSRAWGFSGVKGPKVHAIATRLLKDLKQEAVVPPEVLTCLEGMQMAQELPPYCDILFLSKHYNLLSVHVYLLVWRIYLFPQHYAALLEDFASMMVI